MWGQAPGPSPPTAVCLCSPAPSLVSGRVAGWNQDLSPFCYASHATALPGLGASGPRSPLMSPGPASRAVRAPPACLVPASGLGRWQQRSQGWQLGWPVSQTISV